MTARAERRKVAAGRTGRHPCLRARMRKRQLSTIVCVVVFAASCQISTPSPTPPPDATLGSPAPASADIPAKLAAEQILRVDIEDEPGSLDPSALGAPMILRALQRPLVEFSENEEVV